MVLFKLAKMFIKPTSTIRLAPCVLIIPIILFQALSLSGCVSTSPAIPDIYIVSLEPAKNTSLPVEVRVGYFGICGDDGEIVRCQSSAGGDVNIVTNSLFPKFANNATGNATRPAAPPSELQDIVATAIQIQSRIFGSIFAGASFFFFIGIIFLFLYKRDNANPNPDKPRRSAILRRGTYGLLYLSTGLVFATALATTEAGGVLQFSSQAASSSAIFMHAGRTIQVLQWMTFGFAMIFTATVPILVRPGIVQTVKDFV
ncbi:Ca2+ regulator and membrane fusion protein Fig1-domain-containing protein [Podospora aff. communis PSN243]|uniref:Ca2+ regulator and membrane fusion protein Fig1-domain-containing protein n=1 Tax=Podospora aff. communis PSN243 TaxID=3040156 RepID=A0AAV9G3V2_9PEZI|nr:Ca2+ regulator and membrane fusion protein Fig1-domain-containing protein [Podospora aff. communis PSN243]